MIMVIGRLYVCRCPGCSKVIEVRREDMGLRYKCISCGKESRFVDLVLDGNIKVKGMRVALRGRQ